MFSFRIVWSTPAGRFGFVTIEECADIGEAVSHFDSERQSGIFPVDAQIDSIRPV